MILLNSLTSVTFGFLYQLVIGNLILGLLEAFLVSKLFSQNPSYKLIIVANYISAIIGGIISSVLLDPTELNMIQSYRNGSFPQAMFAYTGIAYIITLVVEFPFYYYGVKTQQNAHLPITQLLKILLTVHVFSYIVTILSWLILVK